MTKVDSDATTARTNGSSTDTQQCPPPPFLTVDGVPNFRDIGGKACNFPKINPSEPTKPGTQVTIRSGYLYRCAQPTHITDDGRETMTSTLGVRHIYDFRSFKELQLVKGRYPESPLDIPGVQRHHVPIYMDEDYTPISLAKKYDLGGTVPDQQKGKGYIKAYTSIPHQAAKSTAFRTIVQHIQHHPAQPLAVHCTAGKDRTGVFSALLLVLCGVSAEDIVTDYAYTTYGLGKWREHLIRRLMEGRGGDDHRNGKGEGKGGFVPPPTREEAENIVVSRPEHMREFSKQVLE